MINNRVIDLYSKIIDKIGIEDTIIYSVITFGIMLIYMYVTYNFINARKQKSKKKKEVKSIVDTLTMSMFFIVIWVVVISNKGIYNYHNLYINIFFIIIFIIGVLFNLLGRYYLGNNWGNHVVIYEKHTFINNGVYKIVRHPLYASIMWMIYSIGILKSNYLVIILNTFVFIPFMYYRAKQEEKELKKVFTEYEDYVKKTGMFFPNIFKVLKEK